MQTEQGQRTGRTETCRAVGDPILLRFIHPDAPDGTRHGPHFAIPMRIVRDDADLTMLYTAAGSAIRKRVHVDGTSIPRNLPYAERVRLEMIVGEGTWSPYHTLSIVPAGAPCDIRAIWHEADWAFAGWYVNLQAPLRRVGTGFDSDDWLLDLTVDPDGTWAWKDEDELAAAVALGVVTSAFAEAVRVAGESVIPLIEARSWPFDGSLIDWRPDPAWGPLPIPAGWDAIAERDIR
ncbi:MAG: DUF402 domain-containing protein [Thermomicrobiales bacterium]